MALPSLTVEIAFGDDWNASAPTWTDVSADVRHSPPVSITRGKAEALSHVRAGVATFTLDNSTGKYDPLNASGAYFGDLVPMVPVRIRATHNSVTHDLFRGFIVEWPNRTVGNFDEQVTVQAVDGLSLLNMFLLGDNAYETLVEADAPLGWWKLDETSGTTATDSGSAGVNGTYTNTPTLNQAGPLVGMKSVDFDDASTEYVAVGSLTGSNVASSWTVEIWIKPDSTDTTALQGAVVFGNGVGKLGLGWYGDTGASSAWLLSPRFTDTDSSATPTHLSSQAITPDVWQHWAMSGDAGSGTVRLYVNGTLVDTWASWDTSGDSGTMNVRIGNGFGVFSAADATIAQVAIYQSALPAGRIAAHAAAPLNGFDQQTTNLRIAAVLDLIGWPSGLRSLSTGNTTIKALTPADLTSQTAQALIETAVDSEEGFYYVNGAGTLVFKNRRGRTTTNQATLNDDGNDTPYLDLIYTIDDLNLRNVAQVTDGDGNLWQIEDTTSKTKYAPRVVTKTTHTTSTTEPGDQAEWLAYRGGTPTVRIPNVSLRFGTTSSNDEWAELLSRELGDVIRIKHDPPGDAIDLYTITDEITWTATADQWRVDLRQANASTYLMFTVNDAVAGTVNGSGRIGY